MERWRFDATWLEGCNCDSLCPCYFRDTSSHGRCEGFLGWKVRSGSFHGTSLDDVAFAWGISWPKEISDGHGTVQLYVDREATEAQQNAIEELTSGKHGGGVFETLPKTFSNFLPPKAVRIDFRPGGYETRFTVDGVGFTRLHPTITADGRKEFRGEGISPKGRLWKRALIAFADWSIHDGPLRMDHQNCWGATTTATYTEKGILSTTRGLSPAAPSGVAGVPFRRGGARR